MAHSARLIGPARTVASLLALALFVAVDPGAGAKPATRPADAAPADVPASRPAGERRTLLKGTIAFDAPPADDWTFAADSSGDLNAAFHTGDDVGLMAVEVLPADAGITAKAGPAIVRTLRQNHDKAKQKIVMEPKVEPDRRFALRIHEKYKSGDRVSDELHLYRQVGQRVVMVTVNASGDADADRVEAIQKAGEAALLSAAPVKPGLRRAK